VSPLKKRVLLLTGRPGVGKTSVLLRIVESLKVKGYSEGGMVTREVRVAGSRAGFEILDLSTGRKGLLASLTQEQGPQVGRYRVNLRDIESIGVGAILDAVESSDVVVVDEIGPMELHSQAFKEAVRRAVESPKLVIGVIHWSVTDSLVTEIRSRGDAELREVTLENREFLHSLVLKEALGFLSGIG
jgi:nucleoside-triphosphatase